MKNIIYIVFAGLILVGCSDSFLETENKNTLDVGSFFKTENDIKLAVNAAYTPLAGGGMFGLKYTYNMNTLDPFIWLDKPTTGFDKMIFDTNTFNLVWQYLYFGLYRTSDILANIDRVKGVDTERMNQYKGQLRALRGMYYFYLVTWFNSPIYYDETNIPSNPLQGLKNGTPEQFWSKLEEDLTYASENLPDEWSNADADLGRITRGAANAQLGKALLYKHYHYYLRFGKGTSTESSANLLKAKNAFKQVIESSKYQLTLPATKSKADYQAALLANFSFIDILTTNKVYKAENNLESVWEIQYNADTRGQSNYYLPGMWTGGNMLQSYFSPQPNSFRNHEIDPSLWYEFETVTAHPSGYERDPRAYATCYLEGDSMDWRPESPYYHKSFQAKLNVFTTVLDNNLYQGPTPSKAIGIKKGYYPQYTTGVLEVAPNNFRIIRYADVLLMYAEACLQLNSDADGTGLIALNQVRQRVDMPHVIALTPEAIMHERNVELATEGHRYNDIIRWSFDPKFNINLDILFKGNFNVEKNFYFPIPQNEINKNKGALKQNAGW